MYVQKTYSMKCNANVKSGSAFSQKSSIHNMHRLHQHLRIRLIIILETQKMYRYMYKSATVRLQILL